jgi:hypothetical protein
MKKRIKKATSFPTKIQWDVRLKISRTDPAWYALNATSQQMTNGDGLGCARAATTAT